MLDNFKKKPTAFDRFCQFSLTFKCLVLTSGSRHLSKLVLFVIILGFLVLSSIILFIPAICIFSITNVVRVPVCFCFCVYMHISSKAT